LPDKHYDVIVLGRSTGSLVAAALLARRDFRVLVLGQGARSPSYRLGRHVFRRSAHSMLIASSPAFKKAMTELAQSQTFRRRALALDPMVQLLSPGSRMELPPDIGLFEREVDREFPEVRRVICELFSTLARANAEADSVFERDLVWPPGTFWERRETGRFASALPFVDAEPGFDLLGDLPASHPYRTLAAALTSFASHLRGDSLPPLAVARLHGAWTRGLYALSRGADELEQFLLGRIQAHGGTCRLSERATRILVERGRSAAILIDGEASPIGASFIVTDRNGEQVAALAQWHGILKRAERDWPCMTPALVRYVVSIVVRTEGLPDRLGREVFVMPRDENDGLVLHVVRMDPAAEPDAPPEAANESLLVVETLLPTDKWTDPARPSGATGLAPSADAAAPDGALMGVRERVIAALREALPFFDRHVVAVDSPHDGRPAWLYERRGGDENKGGPGQLQRREVERIHLQGAAVAAEPMAVQWTVDRPGYLSLAGEPVRGPVGRTLLVGNTVLPALGQEGELLAALSAVRLITRADWHKERIRRAMWNKAEIG
jgi:phytoene dehydrogenase-like protein